MHLSRENTSRKVDELGRISIPKSIRNRLEINPGEEVEFFILTDGTDQYVCLTNHKKVEEKYKVAAAVLDELGVALPEELAEIIGDN